MGNEETSHSRSRSRHDHGPLGEISDDAFGIFLDCVELIRIGGQGVPIQLIETLKDHAEQIMILSEDWD